MWGVTIGTAVIQNELRKNLPPDVLAEVPGGVQFAYSAITAIGTFPPASQAAIQIAFAKSISIIWQVMIGIASIGLISSMFMKALPLHTQVDGHWALENNS